MKIYGFNRECFGGTVSRFIIY